MVEYKIVAPTDVVTEDMLNDIGKDNWSLCAIFGNFMIFSRVKQ